MPPDPFLAFKDFSAFMSGVIADTGVNAIKELSEEVAEKIEDSYYSFFEELFKIVSADNPSTPSLFMNNMGGEESWRPLSQQWSDRKIIAGGSENFYHGLTGHLSKAKSKTKRKKRSKSRLKSKKAFIKFLGELSGHSEANVRKLFGPVTLSYQINAKGRKSPIKIEQRDNVISQISRITSHNEQGRIIPNFNNVSLESEISMFPMLKAVQAFSEWYVVDYMSKKQGVDKAQWMKVNSTVGFHSSRRPIRAIITPLISWYATTGLTQAMRKFYN